MVLVEALEGTDADLHSTARQPLEVAGGRIDRYPLVRHQAMEAVGGFAVVEPREGFAPFTLAVPRKAGHEVHDLIVLLFGVVVGVLVERVNLGWVGGPVLAFSNDQFVEQAEELDRKSVV